jgi:hypothetical protein
MTDFSLIQTPNFAQAALGGYQAGRQIGQQKRMDAALQLYANDPDAGAHAVMQIDPEQGYKLQELARQKQIRELTAKAMTGGATAAPTDGSAAVPGGAPPTPPAQTGLQLNEDALHDLARVDPQSAIAVQNFAKQANADQVKQVTEHLQQKGQWAAYFSHFPEGPERTQAFHDALPQLQTMFTPQELAQADLSDRMLVRDQALAASFAPQTELQKEAAFMDSRKPGLGDAYLTNKANPLVPVKGVDANGNETLTFMRPSAGSGATGGAPSSPAPSAGRYTGPDPMAFKGGVMTSGKRTPQGNAAVGGVRNSSHLSGGAADFVPVAGEDLHDLLAKAQEYFGPSAKAFIDDSNHVHVTLPGYTGIPYFGTNGAKGAPQVAKPGSKAEYDALPSGAPYIAPDGSHRVKS